MFLGLAVGIPKYLALVASALICFPTVHIPGNVRPLFVDTIGHWPFRCTPGSIFGSSALPGLFTPAFCGPRDEIHSPVFVFSRFVWLTLNHTLLTSAGDMPVADPGIEFTLPLRTIHHAGLL